jgi:RNA polymerase primary sigma factor
MRQLKITKQVTNRDTLSLDKYLHEIGKVELLSAEKEVELAKRIKKETGKPSRFSLKPTFVLLFRYRKQYQNQGLSLPDLINEGNLGLIKAAERFDETRGFKFISYAVWWIRQSILQALAEQSRIVRLPLNKIGSINKINKTFNKLEQEYQRDPTIDEVAGLWSRNRKLIEDALNFSNGHVSMDAPLRDEEVNDMYDVMLNEDSPSPDSGFIEHSLSQEIERSLATLGRREADILTLLFRIKWCDQHIPSKRLEMNLDLPAKGCVRSRKKP